MADDRIVDGLLDDDARARLDAIRERHTAGGLGPGADPEASAALRQAAIDHAGFHERLPAVSADVGDVVERVAAELADVRVGVPAEPDDEQ